MIHINTNTDTRLKAITNPITQYPARKVVERLRHIYGLSTNTKSLYHGYLAILYEARFIDEVPPEIDDHGMAEAVAQVRRALSADLGVAEVLSSVRSALFNTSTNVSAPLLALVQALPTVRTSLGRNGFAQALLRP